MKVILEKNQKLLNKLKTTAIIKYGTSEKSSGMYIGEANNPDCKENRNILITHKVYDFNDYFTVTTSEQYKHKTPIKSNDGTICGYHEIGEYKTKKILRKYPLEKMDNISVCWAVASDYPSVSYGMTSWRRDVLVLDSDQRYDSLIEAKYRLDRFTSAFNMPKPNYILRNPKSRHIQAGWILDTPFLKKDFNIFNAYIKQIARAYKDHTKCDGDICFNGPACKNPYYKDFETIFPNTNICNIDNFKTIYNYTPIANKINNYSSTSSTYNNTVVTLNNNTSSSSTYNNTDVTLKNLVKSTSKSGAKHYFGDETSRDYLECKWLREWIWQCMRKEYKPSEKEARAKLQEFAIAAAKQTKKTIHSDSELNSKCKCTYKWAVNHFKMSSDSKENKQKVGAAFGNFIQKLQSYITIFNIEKYKKNHLSTRKIAALTGYSTMTISRSNLNKIDQNNILKFINYYDSSEIDFQQKYKDLYVSLVDIYDYLYYSSLYIYNNTDVTVVKNDIKSNENNDKSNKKLENDLKNMKKDAENMTLAQKRLKEFLNAEYTWEEYRDFGAWKYLNVARPSFDEYVTKYCKKDKKYFEAKYGLAA